MKITFTCCKQASNTVNMVVWVIFLILSVISSKSSGQKLVLDIWRHSFSHQQAGAYSIRVNSHVQINVRFSDSLEWGKIGDKFR